jgi:hypothetical protein
MKRTRRYHDPCCYRHPPPYSSIRLFIEANVANLPLWPNSSSPLIIRPRDRTAPRHLAAPRHQSVALSCDCEPGKGECGGGGYTLLPSYDHMIWNMTRNFDTDARSQLLTVVILVLGNSFSVVLPSPWATRWLLRLVHILISCPDTIAP